MELNWLDWAILAGLGFGAVRGAMRGFVVELCAMLAVVLGFWVALRFSGHVAEWLGLSPEKEVLSVVVTFLLVLLAVNLLAKTITMALDLVQLGWANKIAGAVFGTLRMAFVVSVLLNLAMANEPDRAIPDHRSRDRSMFYSPVRAFAPLLVPALKDAGWMARAWDALRAWERDREVRNAEKAAADAERAAEQEDQSTTIP